VIIVWLDIARRQMEPRLRLVMQAIQLGIEIRQAVNKHPLVSSTSGSWTWKTWCQLSTGNPASRVTSGRRHPPMRLCAFREDEFILDPTGYALLRHGLRRHQFKNMLAAGTRFSSIRPRNPSAAPTSTPQRRRICSVLVEISKEIDERLRSGGDEARTALAREVAGGEDGPAELQPLPRPVPRRAAGTPIEGDMRTPSTTYDDDGCEHIKLMSPEIDKRIASDRRSSWLTS
jgi:arginine decarboxylase